MRIEYFIEILILLFGYGITNGLIAASVEKKIKDTVSPMLDKVTENFDKSKEKMEKYIEKKQDKEMCGVIHLNLAQVINNMDKKLDQMMDIIKDKLTG